MIDIAKALQILNEPEGLLNMPLKPPEWRSKATKCLPAMLPFGI